MCGIAGIIGEAASPLLQHLVDSLKHRGPDGTGIYSHDNNHICITRLSIVDLKAPAGPFVTDDGLTAIVFNGEIYNHSQLRDQLKSKGYLFKTKTDTEVVLNAYREFGNEFVSHLDGMFALAILDQSKIILVRDRLGIKPLYYAVLDNTLVFASEIKAILKIQKRAPSLCTQSFADFILLGFPTGEMSFFEGIKLLLPGNLLSVEAGSLPKVPQPKRYYIKPCGQIETSDLPAIENKLMDMLESAIESHLKADVPIGISLSGGLDSAILTFLTYGLKYNPITTFSIADREFHPDLLQAQTIAKTVGSAHYSFVIGIDEFVDAIPGFIASQETPASLSGLSFYLLCKNMSQHLKACLIGEGADELFGGYPEYLDPRFKLSSLKNRLSLVISHGIRPSDFAINAIETLVAREDTKDSLGAIFKFGLGDQLERLHLHFVDKASMAFGVEMRVPYLDKSFYEFVTSLPLQLLVRRDLSISKYILKRSALKKFGSKVVDAVLRRKMGIPAAVSNHRSVFHNMCKEILPDNYLKSHPLGFCFTKKEDLMIYEIFENIFIKNKGDVLNSERVIEFLLSKTIYQTP
jgi:asparagine synthase (glutamine-hydrolysing)